MRLQHESPKQKKEKEKKKKTHQRSSTCAVNWVLCTAAAQEARPPSASPA
jgi:hypothetical protein